MSQGFVLDWVAQASLPVFSWEDEHRQGRLCHHSKIHYLAYLRAIRVSPSILMLTPEREVW